MKTPLFPRLSLIMLVAAAPLAAIAGEPLPVASPSAGTNGPTQKTQPTASSEVTGTATNSQADTNSLAATPVESLNGELRLNFRNAPLNLVLDYLSDAAGFVINKTYQTELRGTVDVWSKDPVTREEAVKLLNSALKKNGYGATRDDRILTIFELEQAKTTDLPIEQGSNWEKVEKGDEVVTQIIPVRYANATQLMNNLQVLLPTSANLSVNESANSLILVATKTDIRRMLKIVNALDTSIASVSSIKVFPLRYADAKQLVTVIQQLFGAQGAQGGMGMNPRAQLFNMFRGGGFPGGPGGQAGASGGGSGSKVAAAADDYSNSLIVSASTELMATISDMVQQIDQPASDITEVRVFHLLNADPTQLADMITQLFPDDTRSGQDQRGGGFRFGGGRFAAAMNQASSSDRAKRKSRVLAVADARTSSLIVTAASEIMPQLAQMIEELDASKAGKEVVTTFELQNADPQDVTQVLDDLFHRNTSVRQNNSTRSLLGQNNPLTQRATQQQNTMNMNNTGFGNTGRGGSGFGF